LQVNSIADLAMRVSTAELITNYDPIAMKVDNDINFTKNGVIVSINDEIDFKLEEILEENKVYLKTESN
ncbi:6875_t:CDS:2, partial [Gigaspora margarita]